MNKRKEMLKTKPSLVRLLFMSGLLVLSALAFSQQDVSIENDHFKVSVSRGSGVISSLFVKKNNSELVSEQRLASNFRINLQLKDNLANYIDGAEQKAKSVSQKGNVITVSYSGMKSPIGTYNIDLAYTITLTGDQLSFKSKLVNKDKNPVSEFWFGRTNIQHRDRAQPEPV
jgi:hypothetical protein